MPQGFAGGNQPSAPENYPSEPMGGAGADPYMDSYLTMQALQGGLPTAGGAGQGSNTPSMMDQYQKQMQAPNAMLAAMTGRAVNAPEELSRLFPNNPRVGNALSNAGLAMSMIPTGHTIGENIQGVSNAMTELPYARLMHAYQMLQPSMQGQMGQAGVMKALAQAEMFGGKNLAQVEAARQRDVLEAQYSSQNQQAAKILGQRQYQDFGYAPADDPGGHFKKGEYTFGTYSENPVYDQNGRIISTNRQFTPQTSFKDYQESHPYGASGSTFTPKGAPSPGSTGQQFSFLINAYKEAHPGASDEEAGEATEKLIHASPALGTFFGELGAKDTRTTFADQGKAATDLYNKALSNFPKPDSQAYETARDNAYDSYARQFIAKKQKPPLSEREFSQQYDTAQKNQRALLDTAYSKYNSMAPSAQRPDFQTFLQQQMNSQQPQQQSAPTQPGGTWDPVSGQYK